MTTPFFNEARDRNYAVWLQPALADFRTRLVAITGDGNIVPDYLFYIYRAADWNVTFFYGAEINAALDPTPAMFNHAANDIPQQSVYVLISMQPNDLDLPPVPYFVRLSEDTVYVRAQLGTLFQLAAAGSVVLVTDENPPQDVGDAEPKGLCFIKDNVVELKHSADAPFATKVLVPSRFTAELLDFNELLLRTSIRPANIGL